MGRPQHGVAYQVLPMPRRSLNIGFHEFVTDKFGVCVGLNVIYVLECMADLLPTIPTRFN
jgi:hypothetical protein